MKHFLRIPLILGVCCLCCAAPLSAQTAENIRADYEARLLTLPADHVRRTVDGAAAETVGPLRFLYAYMSLPDMADYSPQFYVEQVETSLRARREMPWGSRVPEREWLHFVLPVRVNNEHLDRFRTVCYEELRERVRGLSMYEAVLEVNHWCHEYVTYRPSDARTSPPLSSMRSAIGRCGEESTFTVAALRAVGIPARQVYTPRWAHTDDNHAWVEAWVDGKWYFLGACEPEPVLNLGWFNAPASRGMLMHTKVFGRYDGPEEVIRRTPCYTEINVTENYARVARATVRVEHADGTPAAGVHIDFRLYNYAELYTVLSTQTDAEGRASISAGLGDLVAWATDGRHFGLAKVTPGAAGEVVLRLNHTAGERFQLDLDITPPRGENNLPRLDAAQVARCDARKAHEDSVRRAYEATFPDSGDVATHLLRDGRMDTTLFARLWPLVSKSRGNSGSVLQLYHLHGTWAIDFMETLTDKDLRDFEVAVADDHLLHTRLKGDYAYQLPYVLCPRIATEHLTPWRSYLQHAFSKRELSAFRKAPAKIARWIAENVAVDSVWNPLHLWLSPEAAHRLRRADARSCGLLFVAIARSAGVPARINSVDGSVEYADEDGQWHEVHPAAGEALVQGDAAAPAVEGNLRLTYVPRDGMENPKYYTHFTLSRLQDGLPQLQEYDEGVDWQHCFGQVLAISAGNYLLTSGTRMADGGVLARLSFFPVAANPDAVQYEELVMRRDSTRVQVIGGFNSENLFRPAGQAGRTSLLSVTGRGYYALALLRPDHEPSNHILHDLERERAALEAWGRPILLLFPSEEALARFESRKAEFPNLPRTVVFGVDDRAECLNDLCRSELLHSDALPVVIVADTFNRVVFRTQGYTIGIGDQLVQTVAALGRD